MSAYADDVSLFLRDSGSFVAFTRLFTTYSELSGARINMEKSRALRFGAFPVDLLGGVEWVEAVKVLGVTFHASGEVARATWKGLLVKAEKRLEVAARFKLSFAECAYVIKACASAAFYYVARVARPPRFATRKIETLLFSFFWGGKTERVARALLRLPVKKGGFSLPNVQQMSSILALHKRLWVRGPQCPR